MHHQKHRWVLIIPAAGQGLRFRSEVGPTKQFVTLGGKSLVSRSVETALALDQFEHIVVAVPESDLQYAIELVRRETGNAGPIGVATVGSVASQVGSGPKKIHDRLGFVAGGASRQESVLRALDSLDLTGVDLVFVHDAVRPLAPKELYLRVGKIALAHGAAIPCLHVTDTIKQVKDDVVTSTLVRESYRLVQTPQAFKPEILMAAHANATERGIVGTDDAGLVEHIGIDVHCVPGDETNIKVTTPSDLQMLECLMGR